MSQKLRFFVYISYPTFGGTLNIDFKQSKEAQYWSVTNDTVMGGASSSSVKVDDKKLVFSGILRLEYNGGFSSVYRRSNILKLIPNLPLKIRIKGDGRSYQLRLKTPQSSEISYTASFHTGSLQWTEHQFFTDDFTPVYRGRIVLSAPKLEYQSVNSIGFLLADKQPGNFSLSIDKIYQSEG